MRLLLINPNTSADITERVVAVAKAAARPDTEIWGATGRFGARYILTRAAAAVAAHAALDAYACHGGDADAVVLACFGDPGLGGLRELASVPVVGMAEASCHAAAMLGARFAIVTGGHRWGPMLEEFVAAIGLEQKLVAVKTVAPSGAEIAANPDAALAQLAAACRATVVDHGAEAVILGGAGLAGLAGRIADQVPVPLVDCVAAAVTTAEAMAQLGPRKALEGSHAPTAPIATIGLEAELRALMERSAP
jgi:allantoin racemase